MAGEGRLAAPAFSRVPQEANVLPVHGGRNKRCCRLLRNLAEGLVIESDQRTGGLRALTAVVHRLRFQSFFDGY
jgi:hypothetical protein